MNRSKTQLSKKPLKSPNKSRTNFNTQRGRSPKAGALRKQQPTGKNQKRSPLPKSPKTPYHIQSSYKAKKFRENIIQSEQGQMAYNSPRTAPLPQGYEQTFNRTYGGQSGNENQSQNFGQQPFVGPQTFHGRPNMFGPNAQNQPQQQQQQQQYQPIQYNQQQTHYQQTMQEYQDDGNYAMSEDMLGQSRMGPPLNPAFDPIFRYRNDPNFNMLVHTPKAIMGKCNETLAINQAPIENFPARDLARWINENQPCCPFNRLRPPPPARAPPLCSRRCMPDPPCPPMVAYLSRNLNLNGLKTNGNICVSYEPPPPPAPPARPGNQQQQMAQFGPPPANKTLATRPRPQPVPNLPPPPPPGFTPPPYAGMQQSHHFYDPISNQGDLFAHSNPPTPMLSSSAYPGTPPSSHPWNSCSCPQFQSGSNFPPLNYYESASSPPTPGHFQRENSFGNNYNSNNNTFGSFPNSFPGGFSQSPCSIGDYLSNALQFNKPASNCNFLPMPSLFSNVRPTSGNNSPGFPKARSRDSYFYPETPQSRSQQNPDRSQWGFGGDWLPMGISSNSGSGNGNSNNWFHGNRDRTEQNPGHHSELSPIPHEYVKFLANLDGANATLAAQKKKESSPPIEFISETSSDGDEPCLSAKRDPTSGACPKKERSGDRNSGKKHQPTASLSKKKKGDKCNTCPPTPACRTISSTLCTAYPVDSGKPGSGKKKSHTPRKNRSCTPFLNKRSPSPQAEIDNSPGRRSPSPDEQKSTSPTSSSCSNSVSEESFSPSDAPSPSGSISKQPVPFSAPKNPPFVEEVPTVEGTSRTTNNATSEKCLARRSRSSPSKSRRESAPTMNERPESNSIPESHDMSPGNQPQRTLLAPYAYPTSTLSNPPKSEPGSGKVRLKKKGKQRLQRNLLKLIKMLDEYSSDSSSGSSPTLDVDAEKAQAYPEGGDESRENDDDALGKLRSQTEVTPPPSENTLQPQKMITFKRKSPTKATSSICCCFDSHKLEEKVELPGDSIGTSEATSEYSILNKSGAQSTCTMSLTASKDKNELKQSNPSSTTVTHEELVECVSNLQRALDQLFNQPDFQKLTRIFKSVENFGDSAVLYFNQDGRSRSTKVQKSLELLCPVPPPIDQAVVEKAEEGITPKIVDSSHATACVSNSARLNSPVNALIPTGSPILNHSRGGTSPVSSSVFASTRKVSTNLRPFPVNGLPLIPSKDKQPKPDERKELQDEFDDEDQTGNQTPSDTNHHEREIPGSCWALAGNGQDSDLGKEVDKPLPNPKPEHGTSSDDNVRSSRKPGYIMEEYVEWKCFQYFQNHSKSQSPTNPNQSNPAQSNQSQQGSNYSLNSKVIKGKGTKTSRPRLKF